MAFFTDINPIDFDDALPWVQTSNRSHGPCKPICKKLPISIKMTIPLLIYNPAADEVEYLSFKMRKAIWRDDKLTRYINLSTLEKYFKPVYYG